MYTDEERTQEKNMERPLWGMRHVPFILNGEL